MNNIHDQLGALGPHFRLPLEALSAVRELHGDAAMLEHALAHPADDEAVRLMALMLAPAASTQPAPRPRFAPARCAI
jgi:hypothetical protein